MDLKSNNSELISKVMMLIMGVLLIDEIENGIHKDVLGKIF